MKKLTNKTDLAVELVSSYFIEYSYMALKSGKDVSQSLGSI